MMDPVFVSTVVTGVCTAVLTVGAVWRLITATITQRLDRIEHAQHDQVQRAEDQARSFQSEITKIWQFLATKEIP